MFNYSKELVSINPSNGKEIWKGMISTKEDIEEAVEKAQKYQNTWRKKQIEERQDIILNFASLVKENTEEAARIISEENGKPLWEAKMEVKSLINKVQVVFDAYEERAKTKYKEFSPCKNSFCIY